MTRATSPPRRGLSREEAAMRLGVSTGIFDELRADALAWGRPTMPAKERVTRSRSKARAIKQPERGSIQDAASILGKHPRTVRAMAGRGELPGAAKIGGTWTFNLDILRTFVSSKEQEVWQSVRPQRAVSGATTSSMGGYKPAAKISNGHYEQTIQQLRKLAARQSEPAQ